jgi:hypothetical protein
MFGLLGDGDIAVGATGAQQSSMMLRLSTVEAMGCSAKCAPGTGIPHSAEQGSSPAGTELRSTPK